jgi:hypothetical protein
MPDLPLNVRFRTNKYSAHSVYGAGYTTGGSAMLDYRIYTFTSDNHIADAAVINCETDQEAIEKARQLMEGRDIEVWQRARRLARIKASEGTGIL